MNFVNYQSVCQAKGARKSTHAIRVFNSQMHGFNKNPWYLKPKKLNQTPAYAYSPRPIRLVRNIHTEFHAASTESDLAVVHREAEGRPQATQVSHWRQKEHVRTETALFGHFFPFVLSDLLHPGSTELCPRRSQGCHPPAGPSRLGTAPP